MLNKIIIVGQKYLDKHKYQQMKLLDYIILMFNILVVGNKT